MTAQMTPEVTRLPLPDVRATSDHSCNEVATIGDARIVGRVWRNVWRDAGTLHVAFDTTVDGLVGLSSDGRDDPALLREAAAVLMATADELAAWQAKQAAR